MKRLGFLLLPFLAALVLAPAASARPPRAVVTSCDRVHSAAVFEGRMDAIAKATRMQMRFRLQVSSPDAPAWTRLAVPGFSSWVTSESGRTRYVYSKRVEALLAPAGYRVLVKFRWLDATGTVLKTARATSRACRQPDPRADLRVGRLTLAPGGRYDVALRNSGHTDAPASTLQLQFSDGSTSSADVPPMAPGDREDVFLSGPACRPGDSITVIADAADVVDEPDEAGNVVSLPCPSA